MHKTMDADGISFNPVLSLASHMSCVMELPDSTLLTAFRVSPLPLSLVLLGGTVMDVFSPGLDDNLLPVLLFSLLVAFAATGIISVNRKSSCHFPP